MQYSLREGKSMAHLPLDEKASLRLSSGRTDGLLSTEVNQFYSVNRSETPQTRFLPPKHSRTTSILQI